MPVFMLKNMLPLSEYYLWQSYFTHKSPQVPEIQMAVLSNLVSSGLGGKSKVTDFLISEQTKQKPNKKGMSEESVRAAFGAISTVKQSPS